MEQSVAFPSVNMFCKSQTRNQRKCVREGGSKEPFASLTQFRISPFIVVLEVLGALPGTVKLDSESPTASHRCNVSSELCCPDAKLRRWAPPLVTRFGVILRVK